MKKEKEHQTRGGEVEVEDEQKSAKIDIADAEVKRPAVDSSVATEREMPSSTKAHTTQHEPAAPTSSEPHKITNKLREFRIERMMSKSELARKAGLSVLTVARIEKGYGSRMDTKRKILKALGLKLSDRRKVFEDE